jgi:hypothetical protein
MQMLKEVFQREDERFNLKNGAICISIVVLIVFLAFAFRGVHVSLQQSPPSTQVSPTADDATGN